MNSTNNPAQELSILIVDDLLSLRSTLIKALRTALGHEIQITEAASGMEAIQKVQRQLIHHHCNFNLIFMDFHMPSLDNHPLNGQETTLRIRRMEDEVELTVDDRATIITHSSDWNTPYHEANAVLLKPCSPASVRELLSQLGIILKTAQSTHEFDPPSSIKPK